jgi:hypothetical protein
MARSLLDDEQYKLQFAGHETFPLRYGWLNKAYDQVARLAAEDGDTNAIFNDDESIALFGVGKNMVVSMRHWALAAGVICLAEAEAGARQGRLRPSEFGDLLLGDGGDPYLEHPASMWLIHWNLASRPGRATTWYWAFNELSEASIDRELLTERLMRRIAALRESGRMKEFRVTEATVKRDVECFVRTYLTRPNNGRSVQEDNLESPLSELGLMQSVGIGNAFRFRRGPKPTLPNEVFIHALLMFWRQLYPTRREFSVEAITHEPGGPGRVFLLDEESVAERLATAADLTRDAIRWDESTGMRQVYAYDLNAVDSFDLIRAMYHRSSKALAA